MSKEVQKEWPLVDVNDDGIRPAGEPDECFYCQQKVGKPHGEQCVIVQKTVVLEYTVMIPTLVPHFWDKEMVEFHRNEGSWCMDNMLGELQEHGKDNGCLCSIVKMKCIGEDVAPVRKINKPPLKPRMAVRTHKLNRNIKYFSGGKSE